MSEYYSQSVKSVIWNNQGIDSKTLVINSELFMGFEGGSFIWINSV